MLHKKRPDLVPGASNLKATPSASRKTFKVEGVHEKQTLASLEHDIKTKPRWHVVRKKLSGGTSEGYVIFGDALVAFLKDDDAVAFAQPYSCIHQYGRDEGAGAVYWIFQARSKLIAEDPIRYVFELTPESRAGIPADTNCIDFWLEDFDRAMLESERRRAQAAAVKHPVPILPSQKSAEILVGHVPSTNKITTMFAEPPANLGSRVPPKVVVEDRFPCLWQAWKRHFSGLLTAVDEDIFVVVVPTAAGVLILNPTGGHAAFIGEMIQIPWNKVKSFGETKHAVNFIALPPGDTEKSFHFQTPRSLQLGALFRTHIEHAQPDMLFPTEWPPMRYYTNVHPERNITGLNK